MAGYAGILQADAFDGYNRLYLPDRKPGPIVEALCWSHARRKFLELADAAANARRGKTATPTRQSRWRVRIPMKPARHSNRKPATDSDLMSATWCLLPRSGACEANAPRLFARLPRVNS
jgi:Transposase IS66 family